MKNRNLKFSVLDGGAPTLSHGHDKKEDGAYNAMTVDVEDYYMVSGFADVVRFEDWKNYDSRVQECTLRIVEALNAHDIKATFFILGWIAEKYPMLIKKICGAGHEIACHSYNHRLVYDLSPKEFREDVHRAKKTLEDLTGKPVIGYRAPSYSIMRDSFWALDELIKEGFRYDSSIFPIYHDRYGVPDAERFAHTIKRPAGEIREFPPSTLRLFGFNIPVAGGGYFRLFPYGITRFATKMINKSEKQPVIFYIHPWEIDTGQPRINGKWASRFRHYLNINSTMPKIRASFSDFKFKPLAEFL